MFKGYFAFPITALLLCLPLEQASSSGAGRHEAIAANDNRTPAGALSDGVLTLNLRASRGAWRPEGENGRVIVVEAFGEGASTLSIPAPLVRAPEGTIVAVTIRNDLPHALSVHGLCDRGVPSCAAMDVPAGETRLSRFATGPAGTYHYWATTTGMPQNFRGADDAQLSGAFIVDAPGAPTDDRVFVITEYTSLTRDELRTLASADDPGAAFLERRPDVLFAMNGRVWPHTERLRYQQSQQVRWRVVNLTTQVHPMHLHGFYFDVERVGDGRRDKPFAPGEQPRVVTHVMLAGSTVTMSWIPERAGNWLFHCHVMTHVSPMLHVDGTRKAEGTHQHHAADDPGAGMTGMVLGITVEGRESRDSEWRGAARRPRTMTLEMKEDPHRFGAAPGLAFAKADGAETSPTIPGPTLVLTRGQTVEITLVNRLREATAIHWHGMELDSYYDGVHGFGGTPSRVTPMIEPGESFVVRFTPPRSGTFMYHTHLHDRTQLTSGLYGAMLVVEPGDPFDPATDHVLVIGRGGPEGGSPVVINNDTAGRLLWRAGATHRVRLINITPDDIVSVTLHRGGEPVLWTPLTKDGAPVPASRRMPIPSRQTIAVGETYDFEYETPSSRSSLWLELRTPAGRWLTQAHVIVK